MSEQGFSLHAAVRCDAHERSWLAQLCRDIAWPALANKRVGGVARRLICRRGVNRAGFRGGLLA